MKHPTPTKTVKSKEESRTFTPGSKPLSQTVPSKTIPFNLNFEQYRNLTIGDLLNGNYTNKYHK